MQKVTIYVDHVDDASDFDFMQEWLKKWEGVVRVTDYSTGGWEHIWDLEGPEEAISEIPKDWHCSSKWATPEIFKK
ncbi:hypothetical protein ACUY1T_14540 [Billgrantia sp. Q4P2]|uniref:hypothetical protein n=1 Tax=Billgrantia sp. Q4P2 TaxID=3463857 RepID=UPI0040559F91